MSNDVLRAIDLDLPADHDGGSKFFIDKLAKPT
jgi:hypothetical protein